MRGRSRSYEFENAVVEPGAEPPDRFRIIPHVHPVGEQNHAKAAVRIDPERGASETEMTDGRPGKMAAGGGIFCIGPVESQGAVAPCRTGVIAQLGDDFGLDRRK